MQVLVVALLAAALTPDLCSANATSQPALSDAEAQYQRALALRSRPDAAARHLREATQLLKSAADVRIAASVPANSEDEEHATAAEQAASLSSRRITVTFANGNNTYWPAVRELAKAFEAGEGVQQDMQVAAHLMERAADGGDPEAQRDLGFRAALGIQPSGPLSFEFGEPDVPRALLHYYFAAAGNDSFAQLALGYRHAHGHGVPKSCQAAVLYYNPVAEQVVELARHPWSLPQMDRVRLSAKALEGGRPAREQDVLHYQWFADLGNVNAQLVVAQLLAAGGAGRNPAEAVRYFQRAAEAGDADAMAALGHMYANGRGVKANNGTALRWFRAAAELNQPSALYGLGYMHLTGHGVPQDYRKAYKHFSTAAEHGNTEAWFHLGVMHLNGWGVPRNPGQAQYFFSMTAKTGHALGMYNLAMMHLAKDPSNCNTALELLKKVAEKGPWAAVLQQGREAFADGDYDAALLHYLRAAEMGMELGQSNAAWLLTQGYSRAAATAGSLAVGLHQHAAEQGHKESLLAVGDAFWYGRGTKPDWWRAAEVYSKAVSPQAYYNLGYMHQYGAGLPQDLHLAKRFYDRAAEASPDAWLPVRLALLGLSAHRAWQKVSPLLPDRLAWLRHYVFAAPQPPELQERARSSHIGLRAVSIAVSAAADWAGRITGVSTALQAGSARLSSAFSGSDGGETLLLLGLMVVLAMVLRRRAALRTLYGPPPGPIQRDPAAGQQPERRQHQHQHDQQQQPEQQHQPPPGTEAAREQPGQEADSQLRRRRPDADAADSSAPERRRHSDGDEQAEEAQRTSHL